MNTKLFVYIGLIIGSTIGSLIPELWGADMFSFSSIILSAVGAVLGIWLGFKISKMF